MYAQGQTDYAFRIIDPPTVPDKRERVFPQRILFIALGLLAGLVGPKVLGYVSSSRSKTAKLQIEELVAALDLYKLYLGPEEAQNLPGSALLFRLLPAEPEA